MEVWALVMFAVLFLLLLLGFPIAFTLGAVAFGFGSIFLGIEFFDLLPLRIWGIITNFTLLAVPLFVFMGVVLEKSGIAEQLLETMGKLFGRVRGGLAISVVIVGALLAATTGVVGASVVTMAVIALPAMLKHGYAPTLAGGTIAASGTLGQIIPPSIILILLGDVIGVPVGQLFMGAAVPGMMLVLAYMTYIAFVAWRHPDMAPAIKLDQSEHRHLAIQVMKSLLPPLALIITVLGSIFFGVASPTESAAVGALGAMLLAVMHGKLTLNNLNQAMQQTTRLTSMVFLILIGATAFGLVFVGMGGDDLIFDIFDQWKMDLPATEHVAHFPTWLLLRLYRNLFYRRTHYCASSHSPWSRPTLVCFIDWAKPTNLIPNATFRLFFILFKSQCTRFNITIDL